MEIAIAVFLSLVGIGMLVGGWLLWQRMMQRAAELDAEEAEIRQALAPTEELYADGLVCLFAHKFVRPAPKKASYHPRERAWAPITGQELDPEDYALELLYALMAELFQEGAIDFRVVEREPPYMPPFPQKAWELQVRRMSELPRSPLANAMSVAFDLLTKKRGRHKRQRPEEQWVAIDDLVDRMLRTIRQELSFWERSGVYGDFRVYVENTLVGQGYLLPPERQTWLDRVRAKRPRPNEEVLERLEEEAEALRRRLVQFRCEYGSERARSTIPEEGPLPITEVDPELTDPRKGLDELPLDDCLRVSLYEVLSGLRQLEPSGDAGA